MRNSRISYRHITLYIILLILTSVASGFCVAFKMWAYLLVIIPLLIFSVFKLVSVYTGVIGRVSFIIKAVKNDDYSFRFSENPNSTENSFLNHFLNQIKDVMDEKKHQMREDEKNFELIMEYANIGIILLMQNGTVIHANSKALAFFSLPRLSHIENLRAQSGELVDILENIKSTEQISLHYFTEMGDVNLVLSCAEIKYKEKNIRVVTIGNINKELDKQEAESWEKLTRILTHEIMNSLAPITSISNTLIQNVDEPKKIGQGLEIIHSTSERLMNFVNSFRQMTRVPAPQKSPFYLRELISDVLAITDLRNIEVKVNIDPADTMLYADRTQLSQVILNLLKNAIESCEANIEEKDYFIEIQSQIDSKERIMIEFSNNAGRIADEVAENIFTPFFTTKQDGSGIGLALSRQIIRLHGGTLHLSKNTENKVTFLIILE